MTTPEQLCYVCHNVMTLYGSADAVSPWLCKCQKNEVKKLGKQTKQMLLDCQCPIRVLKHSGRKVRYCRCD